MRVIAGSAQTGDEKARFAQHLHGVLGFEAKRWNVTPELECWRFEDEPVAGAVTLAAMPSRFAERTYPTGHGCLQLLIMAGPPAMADALAQELAAQQQMLERDDAPLVFGQVLPATANWKHPAIAGWYVAPPVYFDDELALDTTRLPVGMVIWLVPVTEAEAQFVLSNGSDEFEVTLEEEDPDLLDYTRGSVIA